MNVRSLMERASVDLNDAAAGHEFTTWSREQLRAYIEEAVQIAFSERPDLFTELRVLKAQPCTMLQDICDCTSIRHVIGQSDKNGHVVKPLRERRTEKLVWTGRTCPVLPKNFELNEYMIDRQMDKLWLWPQVPAGLDVYVLVECAVFPSDIEAVDFPDELAAAVIQWVLFRAKMVDGENNQAIVTVAEQHKKTFYELLTLSMQDNQPTQQRVNTNVRPAN